MKKLTIESQERVRGKKMKKNLTPPKKTSKIDDRIKQTADGTALYSTVQPGTDLYISPI
jgi:hypothetical protein